MTIDKAPSVLLIDEVAWEGVCSTIAQAGRRYAQKRLRSSPENWEAICELIEGGTIELVLAKFSVSAYLRLSSDDWEEVGERLLAAIRKTHHAVFIHTHIFHGIDDEQASEEDVSGLHGFDPNILSLVRELLIKHSVNVISYSKNSEATLIAQELIWRCVNGLVLRTYVPSGQLWSAETDRFLQLFREYLSKVSKVQVRMTETRTAAGVVYELFSEKGITSLNIDEEFTNFSKLFDLSQSSIVEAEAYLKGKVDDVEIVEILTRFSKEGRRLRVDLKQEYERKTLSIRHRLESELIEVLPKELDLNQLIQTVVPVAAGAMLPSRIANISPVQELTLNFNPQIIHAVNAVVAQELNGDVSLSQNDRELLAIINEHAGAQQRELTAAVRELADAMSPKPAKLTAMGKVTAFLGSLGGKVADATIAAGVAYLQKKLIGE